MSVSADTLHSISAPDRLDTQMGALESVDGVPGVQTVETVYDHLDYVHALNAFLNGFAEASSTRCTRAFRRRGQRAIRS
jgi:hypothetical protein